MYLNGRRSHFVPAPYCLEWRKRDILSNETILFAERMCVTVYQIKEETEGEKYTLLIPALLDAHFPLLKYAFYSEEYRPIILEETEGITQIAYTYTQNALCYPVILMIGQILKALQSGVYDQNRTVVLEPQLREICPGVNYAPMIRKALDQAGFSMVPVVSLNAAGIGDVQRLPVTTDLLLRGAAAVYYGDLLMILSNQTKPYETYTGDSERICGKWKAILAEDLKCGKRLSVSGIGERFSEMIQDFREISREDRPVSKIGVVGELYIKYCHLGNRDLEAFLGKQDCEYYINGITWYVLYYMDAHMLSEENVRKKGAVTENYRQIFQSFLGLQKQMVKLLKESGFYCMDSYDLFKKRAEGYVSGQCTAGDGWLIGAEFANHALNGYNRIICGQPFGCLSSHVCGRGLYPGLRRKLPDTQYVSVDYDADGTDAQAMGRIQMLLSI